MASPAELAGRVIRAVAPPGIRGPLGRRLRATYWCLTGSLCRQTLPEAPPRSLLFLCQGNICRSPFAERMASAIAHEAGRTDLRFSSAGLRVKGPEGSPDAAVRAAAAFGVDLAPHRSQPLTEELAGRHDLLVVMEAAQVGPARRQAGAKGSCIALLPRFDGAASRLCDHRAHRIEDPFGRDVDVFSACYGRIERSLHGLFRSLRVL